jgi:hypothetical protein
LYFQVIGESVEYDNLKRLSLILEAEMNYLETHLLSITMCLSETEDRLREGEKDKEKFIRTEKKTVAERLIDKAKKLIEACDKYLTLTNTNQEN